MDDGLKNGHEVVPKREIKNLQRRVYFGVLPRQYIGGTFSWGPDRSHMRWQSHNVLLCDRACDSIRSVSTVWVIYLKFLCYYYNGRNEKVNGVSFHTLPLLQSGPFLTAIYLRSVVEILRGMSIVSVNGVVASETIAKHDRNKSETADSKF